MGSNAAATLLTQDVLTYQKSENNRNYILNKIYIFIYQYPVARGYIEEEIASDFLLFLVPKLERIIKRYTYTGVSFEVYLRNIIFWQIKTFTQLRKEAQIKEEVFTKYFYNCVEKISFYDKEPDSFNNISVCDYAHSYSGDTSSPYVNLIKSPKGRKKILIIALIHADIINNSLISGVASTCRIPLEQLNSWIRELNDNLDNRYEKVKKLNTLRSSTFINILGLQTKLKELSPESDAYSSVKSKISLFEKQLKHLNSEIKFARGKIHYANVAKILDIPSGTVASTLFYVRKLAEKAAEKDSIRETENRS